MTLKEEGPQPQWSSRMASRHLIQVQQLVNCLQCLHYIFFGILTSFNPNQCYILVYARSGIPYPTQVLFVFIEAKGGCKIYRPTTLKIGNFEPQKKSWPPLFFSLKKVQRLRHFFLPKKSQPLHFFQESLSPSFHIVAKEL